MISNRASLIQLSFYIGFSLTAQLAVAKVTYALDQSVLGSPFSKEIDEGMKHAVDLYDTFSDYNIEIPVYYDPNVYNFYA